jgi:hypothetical protein
MISAHVSGIPLLGQVSWPDSTGVQPARVSVQVAIGDVPRLLAIPRGEAVLTIGDVVFRELSALRTSPGPDPYIGVVELVDSRYWWSYRHVQCQYNIPRRVGTQRRADPGAFAALSPVVDIAAYRSTSLDRGRPWTVRRTLVDIITRVTGRAPDILVPLSEALPIEALDIDGDGATAIQTVLRYMPLVTCRLAPDGIGVEIVGLSDGSEARVLEVAGAEIVGRGHVEVLDRSRERPSAIDVLFTPEIELRCDALDMQAVGSDYGPYRLTATNVAPVSDYSLEVDGEPVGPGTWVAIRRLIDTWSGQAPGATIARITDERLREAACPIFGASLWSALAAVGSRDDTDQAAQWQGRLAALQQHYRMTYMLPRVWADAVREIRPYLCATLDRRTGQRAPARVYADHATIISDIGIMRRADMAQTQSWATNVRGYPGVDADPGTGAISSPFSVAVLDPDQGVISIRPVMDPYGSMQAVAPSLIDDGARRALRMSQRRVPLALDEAVASGARPRLARDSRQAIYLTVVPRLGLYRVRVSASALAGHTHGALQASLMRCTGPVREVRIPPSVETARIAWSMADAVWIGQAITGETAELRAAALERLRPRCINDLPQAQISTPAASLPLIAQASALSLYASMIDAPAGGMTVGMQPWIRPTGRLTGVTHRLGIDGAPLTQLALMTDLPIIDLAARLPREVQSILMRTVA